MKIQKWFVKHGRFYVKVSGHVETPVKMTPYQNNAQRFFCRSNAEFVAWVIGGRVVKIT